MTVEDPPGTHSHPGLRGLRTILVCLAVAVALSLAVGVLNALQSTTRIDAIEHYLGIRREVAEGRDRSLEAQLDALACDLLAGRPADGGLDDQARAEYGCPPGVPAAASTSTAPASVSSPSTTPRGAPATTAAATLTPTPAPSTSSTTTTGPGSPPEPAPAPVAAPSVSSSPAPTPAPPGAADGGASLVCRILPLPLVCP